MEREDPRIRVNQAGYRLTDSKRFVAACAGGRFEIRREAGGQAVYAGELAGPAADEASGEGVYEGDFSSLREEGTYRVFVPGAGESLPFRVDAQAYRSVTDALLKCFYFQRCGMELEAPYAGVWTHKACHLGLARVHGEEEVMLPQTGGWHDAGDYGKYTVAAAKAAADLLLAFETFPAAFGRTIGIPESGNGVPDLLNEVRYELEFLLRMQRPDGSVFHKVTTERFPALDAMPEDDAAELVFSPVSAAAAGAFAASMAMAARAFRAYDAGFSDTCLEAAVRAWEWLEAAPDRTGFRNPADIHTGEYGDETTDDEAYWAAAELFRTTGRDVYRDAFRSAFESARFPLYELGWADVGGYGTLAVLLTESGRIGADIRDRLLRGWMDRADELKARCDRGGYRISLTPDQYIWGSNMVLMNQAMHLIFASKFSGDSAYEDAARNHWDYLLGVNPLGLSYVTGIGARAVRHPHHRPSVGDGIEDPVPGMVAGGPNRNLQDEAAKRELQGRPPALCFVDDRDSYSTNEMTIYWNSPAVFVSACFEG
ncbi:glycoside hydrolase family 9 protein [Cohnella caldifontis]|uniref:glycoside hydrolase family 9 protein n=1 Tax=Cohnella caldifontis TaxID=3027471 RepID=UPI0023ECD7E3|nr:glycoside hydrolase family 9 protein [Cohnella sp. YIM B05605]